MSGFARLWRHPRWTKAHRWLSLTAGAQVVLWVLSGSVFVWLDIDDVHGDHEVRAQATPPLERRMLAAPEAEAVSALERSEGRVMAPTRLQLATFQGRPVRAVYEGGGGVPVGLVAEDGTVLTPLGEEAARAAALHDYAPGHPVKSAVLVEAAAGDYRGEELPVWRVEFDAPKGTRLYVSPRSGKVVARRNNRWRVFDFFWMLHTMDYKNRDGFNHPLVRAASLGALAVILTGGVLLFQRFAPRRVS